MPKSFLVKKSESPQSSVSKGLKATSSLKRRTSFEDYEGTWREDRCPFQVSPVAIETKREPLDISEYETAIENAHTLARELYLPWLRGRGNLPAPLNPQVTRKIPELLSHPTESTLFRAMSPDRTYPFDIEGRAEALSHVKSMPHFKFHSDNSAFDKFVRSPRAREALFFPDQEIERKPEVKSLSREASAAIPQKMPPLIHDAVPPVLMRKPHNSNYSETKTAAEPPCPKKRRTTESEQSAADSDPSEADSVQVNFTNEGDQVEKPFKCSHCVMSFTRPSDLKRHLLIHNNNKPYKCGECDRQFTWFGNFQKHILSHVNGGQPVAGSRDFSTVFTLLARDQINDLFTKEGDKYKCRLCSKDFTRLSGLKTHIRMHTGERPYVCQVCSFAFTTTRALKMHMRLHTGEKPYKCEVCDRAFTRRDEMHTHMYIHKGEKPFKCDKCSASFIRYGHLQRHLLIHSDDKPYKCKLCPKSFTQYRNLQTHMYKHTGERPYRCKFCPKGFTQYGTLQAHERTHTGEKPFKCQMCDKAFITSSHLRWHIKTQHGEKFLPTPFESM